MFPVPHRRSPRGGRAQGRLRLRWASLQRRRSARPRRVRQPRAGVFPPRFPFRASLRIVWVSEPTICFLTPAQCAAAAASGGCIDVTIEAMRC